MTTRRNVVVGDVVIYFFRTSPVAGGALMRPAIVTSLAPEGRLNLHVFFEHGDREVAPEMVVSSMGTRVEIFAQNMADHVRMNVPEILSGREEDRPGWLVRPGGTS